MPKIIIEPFEKAVLSLEDAINQKQDIYMRDSVIQRYEYTFELGWKMIQKFLSEAFNVSDQTYAGALKEALKRKMISNTRMWLVFRKMRNYTSHAYNEPVARMAYLTALNFLPEAKILLKKLKEINKKL